MSSVKVIFSLFGVLIAVYLIEPNQAGPLDFVKDTFSCIQKVTSAFSTCEQTLQDRLDFIKMGEKESGVEIDKSMFTCCYFAEFSHCLDASTKGKCGKDISEAIATGTSSLVKTLKNECEDYTYYSPECFFSIYLNVIIIAIIILALIMACCVICCLCC